MRLIALWGIIRVLKVGFSNEARNSWDWVSFWGSGGSGLGCQIPLFAVSLGFKV